MKKFILVAVLVIAGWFGATAYISANVSSETDAYIKRINQLSEPQGIHYDAEVVSGFFTSKVDLKISLDEERLGKAIVDVYAKMIKLPIVQSYEVEHGPLFFRDGFGVGLAKMNNTLNIKELFTEEVLNEVGEISEEFVLYSTILLDFEKRMQMDLHSNAIDLQEDDMQLEMAPLVGSGTFDYETLLGEMKIVLPKIRFVQGTDTEVVLNEFKLDADINDIFEGKYYLGDFCVTLGEASIKTPLQPDTLKFSIDTQMNYKRDDETFLKLMLAMTMDIKEGAKSLNMPVDPKKLWFSMALEGLNGELLKQAESLNQRQSEMTDRMYAMMLEKEQMDQEAILQEVMDAQDAYMTAVADTIKAFFIKDRTKISFGLGIAEDDTTQSQIDFSTTYVGQPLTGSLEDLVAYLQTNLLEYISLETNAALHESHLVLAQQVDPVQIKQTFDMSVEQGMMGYENGSYLINVDYKPKTLKVNGKDMTQEVLPAFEMMLQGAMMPQSQQVQSGL